MYAHTKSIIICIHVIPLYCTKCRELLTQLQYSWNHTKDHNCSRKLCFHHPGHVPVIRGNPDLHFEGAGNDTVVITWIGRGHELYSSASPISLIEPCVTFRHDRRFLSLLGFVHNWPTSRWSARKKENWFSKNGNGIMSFLGWQFYHSTLYEIEIFFLENSKNLIKWRVK